MLNIAEVLPFPVDDPEVANKVNEELRLKYRYLDLRRPEMARNLRVRSKVATATRVFMEEQGFLEVETPTLFKSTPEGAREFLVPNRREPGRFTRCRNRRSSSNRFSWSRALRNIFNSRAVIATKILRADRQPEFTQVDIEMSFIEREDIYALIEGLLKRVWKTALNVDIPTPFKRISFEEALNRYGIDKPDTRFGMELVDFTEEFRASTFKVFSGAIANGGVVKAHERQRHGRRDARPDRDDDRIRQELWRERSRLHQGRERRMEIAHREVFQRGGKRRSIAKLKIEEGDLILFAADQWLNACEILGKIRLYCADVLKTPRAS